MSRQQVVDLAQMKQMRQVAEMNELNALGQITTQIFLTIHGQYSGTREATEAAFKLALEHVAEVRKIILEFAEKRKNGQSPS